MTARDPLFEFMPYGAPELLDARRPHLLRALALASALALAAFGLAQTLPRGEFTERTIEIPQIHIEYPPPLPRVETTPSETRLVPPSASRDAVPVPVPESQAPPSTPLAVTPGVDVGDAPAGDLVPSPGTVTGTGEPDNHALPELYEYVYTDVYPVAVKMVEPVYPEFARMTNTDGRVVAFMLVGKDGRVVRAVIDPKNSNPMFDDAVLAAARLWVFTPGLANEHPVAVWVSETFSFRMR